jgi:hypothetical protein
VRRRKTAEMSTEAAVRRLIAIEEIRSLKGRYWRMIDQADRSLLVDLFTEDAVIDFMKYGIVSGRQEIIDFYELQVFPAYSMRIHHGANPEIDIIDDNNATGIWQYEAWMLAEQTAIGYWHAGWYEDRYRVEDGCWRLAYSKGVHHFNVEVRDQWAAARFENEHWPPSSPGSSPKR